MATEIINGKAIIHGIPSLSGTAGISMTGYAQITLVDKVAAKHNFEKYTVKDPLGFDAAKVAFNEHIEVTVDWTPSAATKAAARGAANFPAPLASITISDCAVSGVFNSSISLFNGVYHYDGDAAVEISAGQPGKLTGLKLIKYADATQNTSLATAAS